MKIDLIILHGALGSAPQFFDCVPFLEEFCNVKIFEFPGHGTNVSDDELSIENCAVALKEYIQLVPKPHIFGYSMGGYVALYANSIGLINPESIITLATKFDWSPEFASKEVQKLDKENLLKVAPTFIDSLKFYHGNNWEPLLDKTKNLMTSLGAKKLLDEQALVKITVPTCISIGYKDKMVSLEESLRAARNIPKAEFQVYPKLQHPVERINWKQVSSGILEFIG